MDKLPYLPMELQLYILYKCRGLSTPTGMIMREFIKENELFKTEVFEEPNFYDFLKLCKILKRRLPYIIIMDLESGAEYPAEWDDDYYYDSELEDSDSGYSSHSNDLELD